MHDVHRDSLLFKKEPKKAKSRKDHKLPEEEKHEHAPQTDSQTHDESDHDDHMHGYDATQEKDHEHMHEHGSEKHSHVHRHHISGIDGHVHGDEHEHPHHGDEHGQDHDHHAGDHDHGHVHEEEDAHHHEPPHGHKHEHDDTVYDNHDADLHTHIHEQDRFEDRAFIHVHDHGHEFYHSHHHSHHPEHTTLVHKVFKDPVRDWFAVVLMGLLILAGYFKLLPGHLSQGVLLCAAVIGVFPVLKNALFDCIKKRRISFQLGAAIVLILGLFFGKFLAVALIAFFLLVGSFMRLNFSWRNE